MAVGDSQEITLEEAAELLRVHYMTVYKYVRTGRIRAERRKGRWVIDSSDLEAFHDSSEAPQARSASGPGAGPAQRWAGRAKRLMARMIAGDGPGSWSIIESSLVSGSPSDMYLQLLAPALRQVGDGWSRGDVSIADEHRATAVALGLAGRLSPLFVRRGPLGQATVLLAGAEGDTHVVPLLMVADALRAEGWSIVNLGADVPRAELLATAQAHRPPEGSRDQLELGAQRGPYGQEHPGPPGRVSRRASPVGRAGGRVRTSGTRARS